MSGRAAERAQEDARAAWWAAWEALGELERDIWLDLDRPFDLAAFEDAHAPLVERERETRAAYAAMRQQLESPDDLAPTRAWTYDEIVRREG